MALLSLPTDLKVELLSHVDSLDTLCTFITAVPEFQDTLKEAPASILSSILQSELALCDSRSAGRSTVIHALQVLCLSNFKENVRERYPLIKTSLQEQETQETSLLISQWQDYRENHTAEEELKFWLERVGIETQPKTDSEDGKATITKLPANAIQQILKNHQKMQLFYNSYSQFLLKQTNAERIERYKDKPQSTKVLKVSERAITDSERLRIFQSIYGLFLASELERLWYYFPKKHFWLAYDSVWQLAAISAFYKYLLDKFTPMLLEIESSGFIEDHEEEILPEHGNPAEFLYQYFSLIIFEHGLPDFAEFYRVPCDGNENWPQTVPVETREVIEVELLTLEGALCQNISRMLLIMEDVENEAYMERSAVEMLLKRYGPGYLRPVRILEDDMDENVDGLLNDPSFANGYKPLIAWFWDEDGLRKELTVFDEERLEGWGFKWTPDIAAASVSHT